jgi:transportin-1
VDLSAMATATWQPRQEGVDQIVTLLTQYQQPGVDHAQIFAQLQHFSNFPDFNNYLVFIFANGTYPVEVRQAAGLLLKNNLKTAFLTTAPEFQAFIRNHVLRSIGSENSQIRSTTGTLVR